MKIKYYAFSVIPSKAANSVHVMKICQAFAKLGHEVELVVPDLAEFQVDDVYEYYGVQNIFHIKRIPVKRIKGKSLIWAYQAARYISSSDVDLAYGRSQLVFEMLLKMNKSKTGFEIHQSLGDGKNIFVKIFQRAIRKHPDAKIVAISNGLKKYVVDHYGAKDANVFVAHDGADRASEKIIPAKIVQMKDTHFNIGYIGQLYHGKGMEIISELVKRMPHVAFHIVGGNDTDIQYWRNKLKEYANIHFYGYVSPSDTLSYGIAMDVMIAPYLNEVYGANSSSKRHSNLAQFMSPLKLFEYMSVGKPIITSDLPVLREIIVNGQTGLLCDCRNLDDWVNAIERFIASESLRNQLGINARKVFEEKFTWEARAKNILRFMNMN